MKKYRDYVYKHMTVTGMTTINAPTCVILQHYFPLPKKFQGIEREKLDGTYFTNRPDTDNICKFVGDALNLILWEDDSQICIKLSFKLYTKETEGFTILHATELPFKRCSFQEITTLFSQQLIYPKDYHGITI